MKRDRFGGRYAIKLGSSVLAALFNVVIQFLLPRAIPVDEYGFYTYNLNVFTSVVVMANLSASGALVAKYSKRCEEIGYVSFYLKFFALMTAALTLGLLGLYSLPSIRESFGGQTVLAVMLGLEASVLIKLMTDVISLYDAAAISRFPSLVQVLQRFALCLFVIGTYLLGRLNLVLFYIAQLSILAAAAAILLRAFYRDHRVSYDKPVVRPTKEYAAEYYRFCRPLVVAGIVSQGIIILMNYTLLNYAGAAEQAMFGAAWQLNTLVAYVFSPYAELTKREFAVLTDQAEALRHRLWQSVKTVIWLSSYFAVFIAVFARWLLPLLFGGDYADAVSVTQMIMIYTVFQAWGQVCGAFLIATEDTRSYAVLSVVGQVASVACVLLFQVPNFLFEGGLGSTGIGLTYMVSNYISVMVMMFVILRKRGGSQLRVHGVYLAAIGSCFAASMAIRALARPLFLERGLVLGLVGIGLSGLAYTAVIAGEIWLFPDLIGVSRASLRGITEKVSAKWKKRS